VHHTRATNPTHAHVAAAVDVLLPSHCCCGTKVANCLLLCLLLRSTLAPLPPLTTTLQLLLLPGGQLGRRCTLLCQPALEPHPRSHYTAHAEPKGLELCLADEAGHRAAQGAVPQLSPDGELRPCLAPHPVDDLVAWDVVPLGTQDPAVEKGALSTAPVASGDSGQGG